MKSIKYITLGAVLTLSVFCAVLYSSCAKDGCNGVTCMNRGTCGGGICTCPILGSSGANCEIVYRNIYAHTYQGVLGTDSSIHTDSNNTLVFTADADTTTFATMHVVWNDTGSYVVSLPITLSNFSSTGSTFVVTTTSINGSGGDSITYTGGGSVNGTSATMYLKEAHSIGRSYNLRFVDFYRQ